MRPTLILLVALVPTLLLTARVDAAHSATTTASSETKQLLSSRPIGDNSQLTERQKWSLARDAFDKAQAEEKRKDNEAAAYYYEVALELLGSLDMASIEVPTRRVLDLQSKVLKKYNSFLASIDNLPSTAGPVAILESSAPSDEADTESLPEKPAPDLIAPQATLRPDRTQLPNVPMTMNAAVAGQITFFMNRGRKVMMKWMERAAYMFPRLRPIMAEEGIPQEVLFLAMIESGLNPRAYSYAHAAGVWQFIPSSGRIYGLDVGRLYDERMHVEESTRAACQYLRKLYDEFGDWYLAFAAYNCGELRVEREIAHSRTRDYFGLKKLPAQTRSYVPAYLATRAICENPGQYGFPPLSPETPYGGVDVWVNGSYRLDHVAQAAGVDPETVADLNPEFVQGVTPSGSPVRVRLPRKADKDFESRLAALPRTVIPETGVHKVRRGETLAEIAQLYDTTPNAIRTLSENRKVNFKKLRGGMQLAVPLGQKVEPKVEPSQIAAADVSKSAAAPKTAAPAPVSKTDTGEARTVAAVNTNAPANHEIIYTVHKGESIGQISRQLGVSVDEIVSQNHISNPNKVLPGSKLKIMIQGAPEVAQTPEPAPKAEASAAKKVDSKRFTHTVQPGDTVWSIARTYGQDPHKILHWNGLTRESTLYPGQELIINQ
ncbi:MAG TPA: LysM peptidoglycan-binding domain-containing protein [bacterium]|jgi:membrane-bound lytic murein transglycosylase D